MAKAQVPFSVMLVMSMTLTVGGCGKTEDPPPARRPAAPVAQALTPQPATPAPAPPAAPPSEATATPAGATPAAPGALPAQAGGGQLAPAQAGYESVQMEAWPTGNRLRVKINGLPVGAYDQHVRVYLDPFLKPGFTNVLILAFDRPPAGGYGVTLTVKAPGNERWVEVLKFMPSKDKLEDSFEVPFVGAKK